MDTQNLQAFVAVAEHRSFSAAAETLHLTQPAVSKRIAQLEERVNTPLFNRIGRQIELTPAGSLLLPRAKLILSQVDSAAQAIADLQGEISGKLSIATSHHIGLHYLPPYLRAYSEQFPDVKLDLHFLDSEQAYQEVLQGRFDLALVTLALESNSRIEVTPLWQDDLQFVAAKNHPLSAAATLSLVDLSQHQAIMPDTNTYTTRLIKNLFDSQGLSLDITMVTNHLDLIKMMLSVGLGWGVLPSRLIDNQLKQLPVDQPRILRPLGSIHHRQRSISQAASKFLLLLEEPEKHPFKTG